MKKIIVILGVFLAFVSPISRAFEDMIKQQADHEVAALAEWRSEWDNTLPLPRYLLRAGNECSDYHSRAVWFYSFSSLANHEFYAGLCALGAGFTEKAALHFEKASAATKRHTEQLIQHLEWQASAAEAEQARQQSSLDLNSLLEGVLDLGEVFLSKNSLRQAPTRQLLQTLGGRLKQQSQSLNADIAQLSSQVQAIKARQIGIGLDSTYRVPLIAQGGHLSHIVKVFNGKGRCTGAFVGPNVVITNFHCVSNDMKVFRVSAAGTESYKVTRYLTPKGDNVPYADSQEWQYDWSLLVLDRAKPDPDNYLIVVDKAISAESRLMVAGYAADVSDGQYMTADIDCPAMAPRRENMFEYNCGGFGGQSGAPVLSIHDHRFIVGLHAFGKKQTKEEARMGRRNSGGPTSGAFIEAYQKLMQSLGHRYTAINTANSNELLASYADRERADQKKDNFNNMPRW